MKKGVCVLTAAMLGWMGIGCGDEGGNRTVPGASGNADATDTYVAPDEATPPQDGGPPPADTPPPPPGQNTLAFQYTTDGTGQPCSTTCTQPMATGETFEVAVVYTAEDGSPIAESLVTFTTTAAEGELKLGAKNAYTNDLGKTSVPVTAGPDGDGKYEVRVSVGGDPNAGTLIQQIFIGKAATPPLKVTLSYQGTQNVPAYEVRLFLREGGKPLCSDIHPDAPGLKPTPVLVEQDIGAAQPVVFAALPGLESAGTQTWMAQVLGPSGGLPSVAGCRDDAMVTHGETTEIEVTVADLPKKFAGTYDAVTWADMYTGLSGTAGDILELLVGLFDKPGQTAILWACAAPSGDLATVCGVLVSGGQLSAAGIALADTADELFLELMADNLPTGVFFTGTSLADLLKAMRFGSVLTFDAEPELAGGGSAEPTFPALATHEEWTTATFQWKFDKTLCPPGTEDCPKTVKLEEVYGTKLTADGFQAGVTADDALFIAPHPVPGFNYGVLVNFLLEKQILPLAFGDGTEAGPQGGNLPKIDSYDKVIATIFGDKWCLYNDDCCDFFIEKEGVQQFIADYTFGNPLLQAIAEAIALGACAAAPSAGGSWIRNQVNQLGANLEVGTPAGAACPALDFDNDRSIDNFGTEDQKCTWDFSFELAGEPFNPNNTWTAKHK